MAAHTVMKFQFIARKMKQPQRENHINPIMYFVKLLVFAYVFECVPPVKFPQC